MEKILDKGVLRLRVERLLELPVFRFNSGFHVLLEIVELRGEGVVREGENLRGEYRGVLRKYVISMTWTPKE